MSMAEAMLALEVEILAVDEDHHTSVRVAGERLYRWVGHVRERYANKLPAQKSPAPPTRGSRGATTTTGYTNTQRDTSPWANLMATLHSVAITVNPGKWWSRWVTESTRQG